MKMKLENTVTGIISFFSPILAFVNYFSLIVGGIWLLIIGQWKFAIFGFVVSLIVPYIISIPLLIMGGIATGLIFLLKKIGNKKVFAFGGFLTSFMQHLVYMAWVFFGFIAILNFSEGYSQIPFIIFGYDLIVGPFIWMASKESPDSYGTFITIFLMEVAYVVLAVSFLIGLSFIALPLLLVLTFLFDLLIARTLSESLIGTT